MQWPDRINLSANWTELFIELSPWAHCQKMSLHERNVLPTLCSVSCMLPLGVSAEISHFLGVASHAAWRALYFVSIETYRFLMCEYVHTSYLAYYARGRLCSIRCDHWASQQRSHNFLLCFSQHGVHCNHLEAYSVLLTWHSLAYAARRRMIWHLHCCQFLFPVA